MSKYVDKAVAEGDRSMAIAELMTDMQDSPRYDKYSLDQIRDLAEIEIARRMPHAKV